MSWWSSLQIMSQVSLWLQVSVAILGLMAVVASIRVSQLQEREDDRLNDEVKVARSLAENIKEQQLPWALSIEQKKLFSESLSNAPKGAVAVEYIRSDEKRVYDFAVTISDLLRTAGYDVWGYMPGFQQAGSPPLIGVMIIVKDPISNTVADGIQRAFEALGIKSFRATRNNDNYESSRVVVWIGSKP